MIFYYALSQIQNSFIHIQKVKDCKFSFQLNKYACSILADNAGLENTPSSLIWLESQDHTLKKMIKVNFLKNSILYHLRWIVELDVKPAKHFSVDSHRKFFCWYHASRQVDSSFPFTLLFPWDILYFSSFGQMLS